jgi:hypothetical protein
MQTWSPGKTTETSMEMRALDNQIDLRQFISLAGSYDAIRHFFFFNLLLDCNRYYVPTKPD